MTESSLSNIVHGPNSRGFVGQCSSHGGEATGWSHRGRSQEEVDMSHGGTLDHWGRGESLPTDSGRLIS